MWHNVRAELRKQTRRPANWLLLAVAATLSLVFGYVIPYAGYAGGTTGPPGSDRGLAVLLPDQFVSTSIGGLPIFVGAIALIFGALVLGSEYGWETWKTVLVQRPSRLGVYKSKLIVVAIGGAVLVLTLFAAAAAASAVVAAAENQPVGWPALLDVAQGLGAGWLIAMMWGSLGVLLALAFRSVALPIGLGLVWMLAVQNLIASIAAPLLDWVAQGRKGMPGPNAGSLVAALGGNPDTPGVESLVGAGQATLVLAAYLVAFCLVGGWLFRRRDIL